MFLRFLLFVVMAILLFGTARGEKSFSKYFDLKRSKDVLSLSINNLRGENVKLGDEIAKIKTSPDYAQKILRDRYHTKEQNENIIFFAD